ncbi:Cobalamin synthesis protein cobW C-terminal domain-containing protein, partial [Sphingobacterium nematocida]
LESAGAWWCSIPEKQRYDYPSYAEMRDDLRKRWHLEWGDRKNEIVFIGQELDKDRYVADLEQCLLTEKEIDGWKDTNWLDEFPKNM